jgi:hypothetical protein
MGKPNRRAENATDSIYRNKSLACVTKHPQSSGRCGQPTRSIFPSTDAMSLELSSKDSMRK